MKDERTTLLLSGEATVAKYDGWIRVTALNYPLDAEAMGVLVGQFMGLVMRAMEKATDVPAGPGPRGVT